MGLDSLVLEAFAKINLSLDIIGRRPDGYHEVETVMHSVSLSDTVTIARRREAGIGVSCLDPSIPCGADNLAHKAAEVFFKAAKVKESGVSIHIEKRIPAEAGLGGGSADAAAVIAGLNHLFETLLLPERLCEIGLEVGMDVPFCLTGGCALGRGRGEILTPLPRLPDCFVVIAKPQRGTSTRRAYELYDSLGVKPARPDTKAMVSKIRSGDLAGMGACMVNVFGALDETGETGALCEIMLRSGALGAALSGSGSATAGIFADEKEALACLPELEKRGCRCWVANAGRRDDLI